jgi:hypothetical protein
MDDRGAALGPLETTLLGANKAAKRYRRPSKPLEPGMQPRACEGLTKVSKRLRTHTTTDARRSSGLNNAHDERRSKSVSHEHKAEDKKGGKNMPWRSEIWTYLELDFGSDQETLNPQAEAWIGRIPQEP